MEKKMNELYPNCSEVIFRLHLSKEDILKSLNEIGIYEVKVPGLFSFEKQTTTLIDVNNQNLPDFSNTSHLCIREENEDGRGTIWIEGHQHCQEQLFPTMKKIEKCFKFSEWNGYDGGSTADYKKWKKDGCPKIKNYNEQYSDRRNKILLKLNMSPKELMAEKMIESEER